VIMRINLKSLLLGAGVLLGALAYAAPPAFAVDADIFELEGNAIDANGGEPITTGQPTPACNTADCDDWDNMLSQTANPPISDTGFNVRARTGPSSVPGFPGVLDDPAGKTIYVQGTKDILDIPAWRCRDQAAPPKNELTNAYGLAYDFPVTGDPDHLVLTFGADRFSTEGSAFMGFWFLQDNVVATCPTSGVGTFSGNHQVGDLLVLANFDSGGKVGTIQVLEWVSTGGTQKGGTMNILFSSDPADPTSQPAECTDPAFPSTQHDVCATINRQTQTAPWPYLSKSGTTDFPPRSFIEGIVDISAVFEGTGGGSAPVCFATFVAETRASSEVAAEGKDFVLGSFPVCGSSVTTEVRDADNNNITSGTVSAGVAVHDHALVTITIPGDNVDPPGSVDFTLYDNGTCDGTVVAGPENVPLTPASPTDGTATADSTAISTLAPGAYSYKVHYSGGGDFPAADAACEPFTVESPQLKVVKHVVNACEGTGGDGGTFDLLIGATTYATAVGNNGSTGFQNAGPGTVGFSENGAGGTDLDNYVKTIGGHADCTEGTLDDGAGSIALTDSDVRTCTITNARKATVNVTKQLVPSTDTGTFTLDIANNGGSIASGTESTPATATFDASGASIVVSEADPGTDYQTFISCDNNVEATGTATPSFGVVSGQTVNCTITNVRKVAQATCTPIP
jgi:hypothetical protein